MLSYVLRIFSSWCDKKYSYVIRGAGVVITASLYFFLYKHQKYVLKQCYITYFIHIRIKFGSASTAHSTKL